MGLKMIGNNADWIQVAQKRVQWRAVVRTIMNFRGIS